MSILFIRLTRSTLLKHSKGFEIAVINLLSIIILLIEVKLWKLTFNEDKNRVVYLKLVENCCVLIRKNRRIDEVKV